MWPRPRSKSAPVWAIYRENVVLYPDMSVRAFLHFCAQVKIDGAVQRRTNVERVLSECALEPMAHRQMGTLSKGYRQRVGLAQALLGNPEVLILDEPTVGLDPNQVIDIRELIKGLGGKATILLSSHILHEVELMCERVVIIDKGRILAEDTTDRLSERIQGAANVRVRASGPHTDIPQCAACTQSSRSGHRTRRGKRRTGGGGLDGPGPPITTSAREIAQTIIHNGWALHELRPVTLDLEALFVRLTREEQKEAA